MEGGVMPKEVISSCGDEQLVVDWTKHDSLDPAVGIGTWRRVVEHDPNGNEVCSDWEPVGPQWALERDTADRMIVVLRRARDQVYNQKSAESPVIVINVSGDVDADRVAALVQEQMLKLGSRYRRDV